MKRRDVIATGTLAISAFGGCSTLTSSNDGPRKRSVSFEGPMGNPPDPFEFQAAPGNSTITPAQTASITVKLRNTSNDTKEIVVGPTPPFSDVASTPSGWMLTSENLKKKSPDCWEPAAEHGYGLPAIAYRKSFAPGEHISRTYELWGVPDDEKCMPTGTFEFSKEYEIPSRERKKTFEWGVALEISTISE